MIATEGIVAAFDELDVDDTLAVIVPHGIPAAERCALLDTFSSGVAELRRAGRDPVIATHHTDVGQVLAVSRAA